MGAMKFEMPNRFGIYLHDTPKKELFASANRWVSNGCVRLEDARRFASWVFGDVPRAEGVETQVNLAQPVPVYMTYLTVAASPTGVTFRSDPYNYDAAAAQRLFAARSRWRRFSGWLRTPRRVRFGSARSIGGNSTRRFARKDECGAEERFLRKVRSCPQWREPEIPELADGPAK